MIASVNEELTSALCISHEIIKQYDEGQLSKAKDSADYRVVASALDDLVIGTRGSLVSVSYLSQVMAGARFDYDETKGLGHQTVRAATYLRETAAPLLSPTDELNKLSAFGNSRTDEVLGHLKSVHALLLAAINRQAALDLRALGEAAPMAMLTAARNVSDALKAA